MSHRENHIEEASKNNKPSMHRKLLNPDSFAALCQIQAEIAQETGWQPSLNKLANALVNADTLSYLKEMMCLEFKNRSGREADKSAPVEKQTD